VNALATAPRVESRLAPPAVGTERRFARAPGLDGLFTAVFALFGFGVGIQRLSDNSFFWHLRTGELILDQGIPHHDPFSFTANGTPWIAQSWLAELTYGVANRLTGPMGIRVMMAVVGAAIAVVMFRLALRLCNDRPRAAGLGVAALACLYMLWSERPLLFGILLFLAVLWVVEVPDSWVGRRPLLVLPVVFWLWANTHGTFALGFAYLGLHVIGRWTDGHRPWEGRERQLTIATAVAFAVTFVNPYGASLVTFPIDLLSRGDVLSHVVEWRSPDFHMLRGITYLIWISVFAVVLARAKHRVTRRDLIVAIPFLLLGFWALRNVAIAPLVCLPIAARAVAVDGKRTSDDLRPHLAWVAAAAIAMVGVMLTAVAAQDRDFALQSYPVASMRAIEEQGLLGSRLLADDADGGYIILEYWPEQKVFFDDRFDMYPLDVIDDFFTVSDASPGWDKVLGKYDVEVILWAKDHPLSELLKQSDEWTITHRDARSYVFVRSDLA